MKVGQQCIDHTERARRMNENFGPPLAWHNGAPMKPAECLENSQGRRAHSDDGTSFQLGCIDHACGRRTHLEAFLVHDMVFDQVCLHWSKRSQSDMQGDVSDLNLLLLKTSEELRCEMQTCRGGGQGTFNVGVNGLVTLGVNGKGGKARTLDIGGEGDLSQGFEVLENI